MSINQKNTITDNHSNILSYQPPKVKKTLKINEKHEYCIIDYTNLRSIIGQTAQSFMSYGHSHCFYTEIERAGGLLTIKKNVSPGEVPLVEIYDNSIGMEGCFLKWARPDGTPIMQIRSGSNGGNLPQHVRRQCKTGLVNMILDNWVRWKIKKGAITPIIFCIDSVHMEKLAFQWRATPETILSRTAKDPKKALYNSYITASELRRAFKLCTDQSLPESFRRMARATLRFVRVHEKRIREQHDIIKNTKKHLVCDRIKTQTFHLELLPAPWEGANAKEFARLWKKRKETTRTTTQTKPCWRKQVLAIIKKWETSHS
jgi:hypothetical protein